MDISRLDIPHAHTSPPRISTNRILEERLALVFPGLRDSVGSVFAAFALGRKPFNQFISLQQLRRYFNKKTPPESANGVVMVTVGKDKEGAREEAGKHLVHYCAVAGDYKTYMLRATNAAAQRPVSGVGIFLPDVSTIPSIRLYCTSDSKNNSSTESRKLIHSEHCHNNGFGLGRQQCARDEVPALRLAAVLVALHQLPTGSSNHMHALWAIAERVLSHSDRNGYIC